MTTASGPNRSEASKSNSPSWRIHSFQRTRSSRGSKGPRCRQRCPRSTRAKFRFARPQGIYSGERCSRSGDLGRSPLSNHPTHCRRKLLQCWRRKRQSGDRHPQNHPWPRPTKSQQIPVASQQKTAVPPNPGVLEIPAANRKACHSPLVANLQNPGAKGDGGRTGWPVRSLRPSN